MSKYSTNAEYDLEKLEISTDAGNFDLSKILIELNLYESILSPYMSGDVMIVDTSTLVKGLKLGNNEKIKLHFKTAGSKNSIKYEGIIYKVSPPGRLNEHASGFVLNFVSEPMIKNNKAKIPRGFKDTTSNIVATLNDQYLSGPKTLVAQETRNIQHYIANNKHPLEVVSDLARKSVSINNEYGYLFFENNRFQNYLPLELLYKQYPTLTYKHKNAGINEDTVQREVEAFQSIQNYEIMKRPSSFSDTVHGVTGATFTGFNLYDKTFTNTKYDPVKDYDPYKSLGKELEPAQKDTSVDAYQQVEYAGVYDQPDISRVKSKMAFLRSQTYQVKIVVNGNSMNKAGDVLDVTIPIWSQFDDTRTPVDTLSGNFLISDIRHVIKNDVYTQHIKLIKDATSG